MPRCLLLRHCFPRRFWTRPSVRHSPRPMTPWSTRHFIPQGSRSANSSNRAGRHRRRPLRRIDPGSLPSFPASNKLSAATPLLPPRQEATAVGHARAKSLFTTTRAEPATQGAAVKVQASVRTDQVPTPIRVGVCLSLHWRQWQAVGANQWLVSVLRDGYRIPFRHQLPPPLFPTYPLDSPKALALRQEVETMLSKGALERVSDPGPGFYSRLFLVEKASGGWRPVIDLSPFNEFVQQTPFKMETAASVLLSARKGDFLASIDLKDVYFQIPVHVSSRKWLRFVSNGTVHQFKVLCFGLSTAPQVFTRVFAIVSAWAHARGVRLLRYLDDCLVLASTEARARQHVRDLLSLCNSLGVVLNREKSDLNPSQSVEYHGMTIDTVAARAYPTLPRIDKFIATARKFLVHRDPSAQLWQVLLGHMSSLEKLVPRGRLRMHSLQWRLKLHWSPERDPPNLPVPRSRQVEEDLSWWMVRDHLLEGTPFGTPTPDLRLYSNASRAGWGAHLPDQSVSGVWSHQESSLHINLLELKALFLALRAFSHLVTDHRVTAMCDNSTVVAYVNKQGGTVSDSLCSLTGQLLRWTQSNRVQLEVRYLPGQSNVLADLLSRCNQVLGADGHSTRR